MLFALFRGKDILMQFKELELSEETLSAVEELGFTEMTEIQEKSIPLLLEGRDVIGRSNTGTGKTAAFGIPAVEYINAENKHAPAVLILCPTRELAMQAAEEIRKFARFRRDVKPCAVYGGASMEKQIFELKRGANIVIGTPGRVMDHIRRRTLKTAGIHCVVLDEADEMLDMGFRDDIESILSDIPEERQTALFSATMPPEILALTEKYQNEPVQIKIKSAQKTVELIDQYYYEVAMGRKTDALRLLLAAYSPESAMVFCNTKRMVDELTEALLRHGFRAAGLHGDMKQSQRTQVMNSFKSKAISILIATDVAARGIDVKGVDAVFNYDLPQDNEYYIHRVGRTGRAGKTGTAHTLVSGRRQLRELRETARFTNADIKEAQLPDRSSVVEMKIGAFLTRIAESKADEQTSYDVVDRLAALGVDYRETAARLISTQLTAELADIPEFDRPKPLRRVGKGGREQTVRVDINIGRNKHIAPNFILGALVDATGMSGKDFGKIDIYDDHTTVEVPESEKDYILESTNPMKINGNKVEVKMWDGRSGKGGKSSGRPSGRKQERRYGDGHGIDRRKSAYGRRGHDAVFRDHTKSRRKNSKKQHST